MPVACTGIGLTVRVPRVPQSTAWRPAELVALAATIPAFYLALLSTSQRLTAALYLVAAIVCAASWWIETRHAKASKGTPLRKPLGIALVVTLLLSAALPVGDSTPVVIVRLATAALVVLRVGESIRPWFWRGELPQLLALAIGVMSLCGLGFWWLEPNAHTFGEGLWLAFTTAATVGYGDIVPSTPAAKIFAVFVVLMGFAVLSLVTAAIAAMWVQTEERRIEHEMLHDLHHQLKVIREELTGPQRPVHALRPEPHGGDARRLLRLHPARRLRQAAVGATPGHRRDDARHAERLRRHRHRCDGCGRALGAATR